MELKGVSKNKGQSKTKKGQRKETKAAPYALLDAARIPKTTAVTITRGKDAPSYASLLRSARDKVSLNDLGIENTKVKRAVNGGIIIELPGENMTDKADEFVKKLKTAFGKEDVVVARPTRRRKIMVTEFDESVSRFELNLAMAEIGGCPESEIKTGQIRPMRNGLYSIWLRCPIEAAIKIVEKGHIKLGWSSARVTLLKQRLLQVLSAWSYQEAVPFHRG